MARDLSLLRGKLTVTPEPGLGPLDERLLKITDLADRQSFREAADLAAELLTEEIFDIRPISILLYQAFLDGGVEGLAEGFEILQSLAGENKPAVGPLKRREEQFAQRIKWIYETVADNFRYHLNKKSAELQGWRSTRPETVQRAIREGEALSAQLSHPLYRDTARSVGSLTTLLRAHLNDTRPAPAPAPAPSQAPAPPPPAEAPKKEPESLDPVVRHVDMVVSHRFLELHAKLRAFEKLIEKGQMEKAAVVSDDINSLLESFDPRDYFPELFATFSVLVSKNINHLAGQWNQKDSPAWNALAQFYRVDLKQFVGK
jgi:hypothetical protein